MVGPKFKGMEMRPGSMGKPAPGMDVRVVDNSGEEVNHGEEGNLGILCRPNKPHGLFAGYLTEGGSITNYKTAGNFYLTGAKEYKVLQLKVTTRLREFAPSLIWSQKAKTCDQVIT